MVELRVAIDARLQSGVAGGVESVIIGLARGLSDLGGKDERYVFLCRGDSTSWLEPYIGGQSEILEIPVVHSRIGDRLTRMRGRIKRAAPFARTIWRRRPLLPREPIGGPPPSDGTVEAHGIDVVHLTTQSGFLTEIPTIYHPHDLQHIHFPTFFSARERAIRERHYRALCEQASLVVVTSEWSRLDVTTHYRLPASRVRVIPWAPPTAVYPVPSAEDLEQTRVRFRLPERFVLYPAQTWPHKNHVALLRAIARIRDSDGISIPVVFSGHRNEYAREIDKIVSELGLVDEVTWVGFVSPTELQALYRLCAAVVIPSRFEAASGPLWEAFLAEAPSAVAAVTSLPDQAGDAALLFDPDDEASIARAVVQLWTDGLLRERLIALGRDNVARFSWDLTARTFRAEYRRLAGRSLTADDHVLLNAPSPL